MISWIVATHDETTLMRNLVASLHPLDPADELVVVEGARSIAAAYNEGASRATRPVRCYVHHDVEVLHVGRLRAALAENCRPEVGMVGVIGSRTPVLPWWQGVVCGSVFDRRHGRLGRDDTGGACAYLDGLLLATVHDVTWDEGYLGWHLYDHDVCAQMLARGLSNWCLPLGRELVRHNTSGPTSTDPLPHWVDGVARFREKWGTGGGA